MGSFKIHSCPYDRDHMCSHSLGTKCNMGMFGNCPLLPPKGEKDIVNNNTKKEDKDANIKGDGSTK